MFNKSFIIDLLAFGGIISVGYRQVIFNSVVLSQVFIILLFMITLVNQLVCLKLKINKAFLIVVFYICIVTFFIKDSYDLKITKNIIGCIIYFLSYYNYIKANFNRITQVLENYVKISYFVAILAILQELGHLANFSLFSDFSIYGFTSRLTYSGSMLRVYSIFSEPAMLSNFLFIPIYFVFENYFSNKPLFYIKKKNRVIMITANILTFSLVGYFQMTIMLIILMYKNRSNYIKNIFFILVFATAAIFSENIISKIASLFFNKEELLGGDGGSALSILSLFYISLEAFKNNVFFGSGFGTTELNFIKYFYDFYSINFVDQKVFIDAMLYPKLLGEFGLIGCILFLVITIKFKISKKEISIFKKINSISLLALIIIYLRVGTYLEPLMFFCIAIYINSFVLHSKYKYSHKI